MTTLKGKNQNPVFITFISDSRAMVSNPPNDLEYWETTGDVPGCHITIYPPGGPMIEVGRLVTHKGNIYKIEAMDVAQYAVELSISKQN